MMMIRSHILLRLVKIKIIAKLGGNTKNVHVPPFPPPPPPEIRDKK
jgi:hypothetical protein